MINILKAIYHLIKIQHHGQFLFFVAAVQLNEPLIFLFPRVGLPILGRVPGQFGLPVLCVGDVSVLVLVQLAQGHVHESRQVLVLVDVHLVVVTLASVSLITIESSDRLLGSDEDLFAFIGGSSFSPYST